MNRIFIFSLIFFCQINVAKAQQWFKYADFPINVIPKDIASNNAGTLFLLTTENSLFYKTLNGSWTKMNTSAATNINCISSDINNNRIYLGTMFGGLFYTSNFGSSWNNTYLYTNPHTGMHEGYNLISNIRDSNLFFATNLGSNKVVRFFNNGTSGQTISVSSSPNFHILDLYYTKNNELLVGSNQGLMKSNDGGNTFTAFGQTQISLFDFTEDDNGRVYALGTKNTDNEYILLVSEPNNYQVWTPLFLPLNSDEFTTIYFDKYSSNLWIGGNNTIYSTSVNNINWVNSNQNLSNPQIVKFVNDSNGNFYSFTVNENCIKSESGAWADANHGLSGDIHGISFGNDNKLFSYNNYYTNKLSSMEASTGRWFNQNIGNVITGLKGFIRYNNNILVACIWDKIFISHNNGESFTTMNLPEEIQSQTAGGLGIVKKGEGGLLFITHTFIENKIFVTNDLGNSWTTIENLLDEPLNISQDSNGNLYVLIWGMNTSFVPELYYSTDNGNSWNHIVDQTFLFTSNSPRLISKNDKTYLEADGKVYFINPAQGTLENINLPFSTEPFNALHFTINDLGEFYIFDSNYNLYKSTDNGINWSNLQKPSGITDGIVSSLDFGFDNTPFILYRPNSDFNSNQGVYYFRNEQLNINENEFTNYTVLYPNPSTDYVNVETDFRGSAILLDMSGRVISKSIIKEDKTQISLKNLSKGIYILRFENGKSYKIIKK